MLKKKGFAILFISVLLIGFVIGIGDSNNNMIVERTLISKQSNNIIVDINGTGDYRSIQKALDNSSEGDEIYILKGTYSENLTINKSISLIGDSNNHPLIVCEKKINIVQAETIIIKNLIFKAENDIEIIRIYNSCNNIFINNSKFVGNPEFILNSLVIYGCNNIIFENNSINNYPGIWLQGNTSTIKFNTFFNINRIAIVGGPNCEKICYYSNIIISKNYGLVIDEPYRTLNLKNNEIISSPGKKGTKAIVIQSSNSGKTIINNNIINNFNIGIDILENELSFHDIYNNNFLNNDIGLRTAGSKPLIYNNSFEHNQIGIQTNGYSNQIFLNEFIDNNIGVLFSGNNHLLFKNNFFNNEKHIINNGSFIKINNAYEKGGGNYWSDYYGHDKKSGLTQDEWGSDGFGDEPYHIDTLEDKYPIIFDIIPPIAQAGDDATIDEGDSFLFTSDLSSDNNLVMEAWWNYSYNGLWQNKSALDFNFIFDIPGYYPVNLTVFDFRRNSDTDSFNITVLDVKLPKAISQGDIIVNEGSLVHFNGSRSSDSGGIAKYEWIFDYDGTSYTLEGVNVSFFFEKPGWIPVTLRVTDNAGHIGESIFNVTIVDITDPIAEAGLDITIDNGEEAILNGSLCSDNGIITYYNWTFEYNGTVEKVQGKEASFKFVIPGIYPVTLRIEDAFGNHAEDKFNVTVVDTISPKPKILGKTQVLEGESMVLNGLQSTDNGRIVKYLWTFEDEGPEEYEGPTVTHRFTVKGMHEVTLTVFDEWNNSASINITVDVVDISSPLADAGPDMLVGVGREVIFDGSGSTDDGRMVQFEWLFNYQGQANVLEGMVSTFTFDVPGTYIVTLRVHDQSENVGADEVEVKVVNYGFVRGILLDGKGTPIRDADVEIIASDGNAYTTKTLANGSFYLEVPQGSFTWKITMDGFKDLSGSGTVGLLSATTLDVPAMEKADSTGTSPILFIVPAVLILLLIIGIAIFLMMRKKGSNEETEESIPEKEPEIPTDIIPTVPPIDPSLSEFTEAPPVEEEPAESFMKGGSHGIGDLIEE